MILQGLLRKHQVELTNIGLAFAAFEWSKYSIMIELSSYMLVTDNAEIADGTEQNRGISKTFITTSSP